MRDDLIIGRNPIIERFNSGGGIQKLYVLKGDLKGSIHKIVGAAKEQNVPISYVDQKKLDNMADGQRHQGVIAQVTPFAYAEVAEILSLAKRRGEDPMVILLDGIEDPHNLGAVIRTAEAAGFHGVIIPQRRSAQVTAVVGKTSAGAIEHIPVAQVRNLSDTIDDLKDQGLWIYGADMDGDNVHFEENMTGPIALVIGNEGKGLGRKVRNHCDRIVEIPMAGKMNSLNASNAAAVLIYEVIRQRHGQKKV